MHPPDAGGRPRHPPPAVRRRGRRRADGDARRAAHPGFVPCRSVEGTPLRRDSGNVGARPLHRDADAPPYARRPWTAPVAAASGPSPRPPTGGGCAVAQPATSARGYITGTPTRSRVPVLRWRSCAEAMTSGWPRPGGPSGITRFAPPRCRRPVPAPAARGPPPRPPGGRMGMRAGGERHPGTSTSGHFTGVPTRSLHARGAGAPDDTSVPGLGGITRFADPLPGGPSRRPPPAVRRRDRWRAEGDARRAKRPAFAA